VTPDDVLASLLAGNRRFVGGELTNPRRAPGDFTPLAAGQNPIAAIVGCADSRVPPEVIFDQGVGDLFVVRTAGNIIAGAGPTVNGSIEFAVAELGVSLVMVLGHSGCGAIQAAITHIDANDVLPGALGDLIELAMPAVAQAQGKPGNQLANVIAANVQRGVARLKKMAPVLADRVAAGKVKVVGAVYDLTSGEVRLLS